MTTHSSAPSSQQDGSIISGNNLDCPILGVSGHSHRQPSGLEISCRAWPPLLAFLYSQAACSLQQRPCGHKARHSGPLTLWTEGSKPYFSGCDHFSIFEAHHNPVRSVSGCAEVAHVTVTQYLMSNQRESKDLPGSRFQWMPKA